MLRGTILHMRPRRLTRIISSQLEASLQAEPTRHAPQIRRAIAAAAACDPALARPRCRR